VITPVFHPAEEAMKTLANFASFVMAGLRPGHPENWQCLQLLVSWMAGSSPAMTRGGAAMRTELAETSG
jgi:hypothetical protein